MIDIQEVWQDTCNNLTSEVTAVAYSLWIEPLEPLCVKDNVLILLAPTLHAKQTVLKNYKDLIARALTRAHASLLDVDVITEDQKPYYTREMDSFLDDQIIINSTPVKKSSQFIARYTFDNFVVGESNQLAFHAAKSVAASPGSGEGYLSFNPLYIYGNVGLGKTHLLHAIGNYINDNMPSLDVLYVPAEKLMNDYLDAIANANGGDKSAFNFRTFREHYRNKDVLMIDDVQFLQKKTGLQDVLFHIFNELYQAGKQIILASDRPPKEIGTLEDRLRSRFEGGLLADIGIPNLEMRVAILRKKMYLEKIAVNDDVVYFLAEMFQGNIRELEGALSKVILYSQLTGRPYPDIETAREAFRGTPPATPEQLDPAHVIHAVSGYFHIPKSDIVGKKKTKDIVEARMVAIYLVNELLSLPLVTIGQIFGGRDHTTVIHARDKIAAELKTNLDMQRKIKDVKALLKVDNPA